MWTTAKAPSLDEMEAMAHEVFERLPETFRALCEGLIIRVDDFPTEEVLDELGAQSEFDLLGLFQGVGLPFRSESAPAQMPNMRPSIATTPLFLFSGRSKAAMIFCAWATSSALGEKAVLQASI